MGVSKLTGDSIMYFGKYKGQPLKNIPDGWFIWMYDRNKLSGAIKEYAEKTIRILAIQAKQQQEKKDKN